MRAVFRSRSASLFALRALSAVVVTAATVAVFTYVAVSSAEGLANRPSSSPSSRPIDVFALTREILAAKKASASLNTRSKKKAQFVESGAIELLQNHSELQGRPLAQLIAELDRNQVVPDPTKHVRLVPPKGHWGYDDLRVYFSHPIFAVQESGRGETVRPAENLAAVWRDFLAQAENEIILNVFDFDLTEVADALIARAKAGVRVRVGIDGKEVKHLQGVRFVRDALLAGGVDVIEVNSAKLNHQKMAAIDWTDLTKARALFSSGNLTQSCLAPEGDVPFGYGGRGSLRPKESIPNANHVVTMRSWLAANLVHHELSKTFDTALGFRGATYPMTGAYQITGPDVPPETFEAYPERSFIITFTPGGAYRSVNQNILARLIDKTTGAIRMAQFAFSSDAVGEALLRRAIESYRNRGTFDFLSVGDTPFAMQGWSQFLKMSGYMRAKAASGGRAQFVRDMSSAWSQALNSKDLKDLQSRIRVAPEVYGEHSIRFGKKVIKVTAKIHHKLLAVGDFAVMGTSFNFSRSAETNNEQILVFRDPVLSRKVDGAVRYLARSSPRSVAEEAERRNRVRIADSETAETSAVDR